MATEIITDLSTGEVTKREYDPPVREPEVSPEVSLLAALEKEGVITPDIRERLEARLSTQKS